MLTRDEFDELVNEALEELPEQFAGRIENLRVEVEEWASAETLALAGVRQRTRLLGFYHGIPLTQRGHNYNLVTPDRISIYRQPILRQCRTRHQVRELVHRVVRHEIAHHFGIDDERLDELGAY